MKKQIPGLGGAATMSDECEDTQDLSSERVLSHASSSSSDFGTLIDRYSLIKKIGEGGFGVVYLAQQSHPVKRQVALKVIKLGMDTEQVVARFEAERQALALMDHPHIAKVFDGGATDVGRPYFVMELVHGVPITDFCATHSLSIHERLKLFILVCQAVQHAHQKGIIHRDLKPSNVLVDRHEGVPTPKVIDFGIAKATQMELTEKTLFTQLNHFVGTPAYMSPEQMEMSGVDVDTRSDIYSLGVLLYELLTGSTPLDTTQLSYEQVCQLIRDVDPPKPSTRLKTLKERGERADAEIHSMDHAGLRREIRGDLDHVVMKALDKDRTRRYETANALAFDIMRYLNDEPVLAVPPSPLYRFKKMVRRNRALVAGVTAVFAALVVGIVGMAILKTNAVRQADLFKYKYYVANLIKAKLFVDENNGGRAHEVLQDAPQELRDWEWDYLSQQADQSLTPLVTGLDQLSLAIFSPDGGRVLSERGDKIYELWDALSGEKLRAFVLGNTTRFTRQIPAFTPDGKRLLTSNGETIVSWDVQTGSEITRLTNHQARAFHVHGNRVMAMEGDKGRFWRILNMDPAGEDMVLQGLGLGADGSKFIRTAAFSSSGDRVAVANFEPYVKMFDTTTGKELATLQGHTNMIFTMVFSPDGSQIVTASKDSTLRVWDTVAGKERWILRGHDGAVTAVAVSPDGTRIVSGGSDSNLKIWDTATGLLLGTLRGHASKVTSIRFSQNANQVLSSSDDGSIRLWSLESVTDQLTYTGHQGEVTDLAFNEDGTRLVSSGKSDGTVQVWDPLSGQRLLTLNDGLMFNAVDFSPNGQQILTAGSSPHHRVKLWDGSTGKLLMNLEGPRAFVDWLCYSPNGKVIAAAGRDLQTYLWDASTGKLLNAFRARKKDFKTDGLAFSPDSRMIATCEDQASGEVPIWEVATGRRLKTLVGPVAQYRGVTFSPSGKQVAVGCHDGSRILVWNVETEECIHQLRGHSSPVQSLTYSPEGNRLFTGGDDDTLRIWDTETGEELLNIAAGQSGVIKLDLSPDGKTLATAGKDGTVKVWEIQRPSPGVRQLRKLVQTANEIVDARFEGSMLAEEVVASLRADSLIKPEVKAKAVEIAMARGDSVENLFYSNFGIVINANSTMEEYRLAHRRLEAAHRVSSGFGGLPFGYALAQYRVGEFQEAYDTLISIPSKDQAVSAGSSLRAMILYRLDRIEEAKIALIEAHNDLLKASQEYRSFTERLLGEASAIIKP